MSALELSRTCCTAPGQQPAAWRDWAGEYAAARTDNAPTYDDEGNEDDSAFEAARSALDAQRIATASHVARNGRGVRVGSDALLPPLEVELEGGVDELGGALVTFDGAPVTCPECGERVRMIP